MSGRPTSVEFTHRHVYRRMIGGRAVGHLRKLRFECSLGVGGHEGFILRKNLGGQQPF